jgi:meiotic recombination protein SPO11
MYYKDVKLFVKQRVVDHYVDDISLTLNVPRSALNVAAAAKGLFAGSICITKENGQIIDGRQTQEVVSTVEVQDHKLKNIGSTRAGCHDGGSS